MFSTAEMNLLLREIWPLLSLLFYQPFWPTGSGCARGFLGAFDAAWMIKQWSSCKMTPLQVIAERESVYQQLSQTTPENLRQNFNQYTLDPASRYRHTTTQFDIWWIISFINQIMARKMVKYNNLYLPWS